LSQLATGAMASVLADVTLVVAILENALKLVGVRVKALNHFNS